MKKWIALAAAAVLGAVATNRMRAQKNERDLWAEATDDIDL